jgi:hypothetical protein
MMKLTATPDFLQLAFGDGTPKKALKTAIVVRTILTTINHGDVILRGESINYFKILLTYCVPFCVTTRGVIHGKRVKLL